MRPKSLILLVLALGCGLIAAIGINQVLANRDSKPKPDGPTDRILVVMADVNPGEEITAAAVKMEDWPKDKVPEGAITDLQDVDGRRARTWLYSGEPIIEAKLTGRNTTAAEGLIPAGYRVVSVKVDDQSAVAGILRPGNRVDVLVYLMKNPGRGIQRTVTKTLMQNIKVFAVNDQFHMDKEERQNTQSISARTVSLLVTPEQAQEIHLASELGQIRFSMRSHEDDVAIDTGDSSASNLFGGSGDEDSESLLQDDTPKGNGILAMLDEQPKPPQMAPQVIKPLGADFTMVLIEGDTVRNIQFRDGHPIEEEPKGFDIELPSDVVKTDKDKTNEESPEDEEDKEGTVDGPADEEPSHE